MRLPKQQFNFPSFFSYSAGYPEGPEVTRRLVQITLLSHICQHKKSHVHYKTKFFLDDKDDLHIIRPEKTDGISRCPPRSFRKDTPFIPKSSVMFCLESSILRPPYYSLLCPMKQKHINFCGCYYNWHFGLSTQWAQRPMKDIESTWSYQKSFRTYGSWWKQPANNIEQAK